MNPFIRKQMKFQFIIFSKVFYLCLFGIVTLNSYGQNPVFVSVSTTDTDCGASLGSITLTPTPGPGTYSYLWDDASTGASILNLGMGNYSCTVTKDGVDEVVLASIYRNWELERFEVGDPSLAIVGNSVTVNPNIPYSTNRLADQRTHCYDKTPIDIENETGSIFAKFAKTHPNFPNQIANASSTAPPVFYLGLYESTDLSNHVRIPMFWSEGSLRVLVGGTIQEKIYADKGVKDLDPRTYANVDYTDGDEFEVRFLGSHQLEIYLEKVLIYSTTLQQKLTNEYIVTIGFNDYATLDRRIAYDLKTSFCASMPVVKTTINHNSKYGATGSITLAPVDLNYVNNTYSYQWSNGSTNSSITSLTKGSYVVTMTNGAGGSKVETYEILDKLSLEKADPVNSILKIIDNHVTCDPMLLRQSMSDYRTHAYDPAVVINAAHGGGSVKFRVSAEHPAFPDQHSNTENYNAAYAIRLQEVLSPLPVPSFFYDYPFQIIFGTDGKVYTVNRQLNWSSTNNQYIPDFVYPKEGFDIELRFTGNKVIEIYMNDLWVATRTLVEPIDNYHLMIGFTDPPDRQRRIAYDMRTSFESRVPTVYTELRDMVNASYYPITDVEDIVYFNYKERYRAGTLDFAVYNEERELVSGVILENIDLPSPTEKRYGTNRYKLKLPSNLDLSKFYLLEVTNDKGEKQFLRFKRI
jgi:hypothetical protein